MILLAGTFVLMVCKQDGVMPHPDDPRPCIPLALPYDSLVECTAAIEDMTKFWLQHQGGHEPAMHCEDAATRT